MQKALPEEPVLNWHSVIDKNVRTKDDEPLGYLASEDKGFLIIQASGLKEYLVPKHNVEAFDGSQVFLNLKLGEDSRYKFD